MSEDPGRQSGTAEQPIREFPVMETSGRNIVLFHPHVPAGGAEAISRVLASRWIGEGPRVREFEQRFSERFGNGDAAVAVGSGTDALHLAYLLAGLLPGDEVVSPLFTCTATNLPFLYMGVKVVFADVEPGTLNIDPDDVRRRITSRTRALVCTHYGGLPCDMAELQAIADEHGLRLIEDAAHAIGATYRGQSIGHISDFTIFSFQAIKSITTGDGGMLLVRDRSLEAKARRIRWFGIDRQAKQGGHWNNDITEVGYKYQMTDIAAALGLAGLDEFDWILAHRRSLLASYEEQLSGVPGIQVVGVGYPDRTHAAWMCTVIAEGRERLMTKLHERGIESAQVHYRNDRYSVFGGRRPDCPNMDALEDKYLVLPLHTRMDRADVSRVCDVIRSGW